MRDIRIKKTEFLYFLALGFYLIVQLLSSTLISAMVDFTQLRMLCFCVVVSVLTLQLFIEMNYKHLWLYLLVLFLFLLVGLKAKNLRDLIILGFLTLEARNIKFNKIVKIDVILIGSIVAITVLLFYCGVYRSVDTSTVREDGITERLSLGFGWTTYAPNLFMSFVLGVLFLRPSRKCRWLLILVLILINYYLYKATNTKAVYYEILVLLALYIVVEQFHFDITKPKLFRAVLPLAFIVGAGLALWMSAKYNENNAIMSAINRLTTYRLSLTHKALELYPIRLFGNAIEWVTGVDLAQDTYFYVDSSYMLIIIQYGLLVFAYIILLFTLIIRHFVYRKDNVALVCLVVIAVHSITDPQLFNVVYTPYLLALGLVLKNWKQTRQLKKEINSKNRAVLEIIRSISQKNV